MNLNESLKKISTFVFDMDGVLTDGTLFVFEGGQYRRMHIRDGYALQLAVKKGYRVAVISGSQSDPVVARLKGLGITDVFMKVLHKKKCLEDYLLSHRITQEEVLYMGDDIPDYEVMKSAGFPCSPADAAPEIKEISRYISPVPGGQGCVRDVIERVLKLNGHWELSTDIASR